MIPQPAINKATASRFWSRVDKSGRCWIWTGSQKHGYGRISIGGRLYQAHRISWLLDRGVIPNGLNALHKCDNPTCVRPDHLFLGTLLENTADMIKKGRAAFSFKGENNPRAVLAEREVLEIRKLAITKTQSDLARQFKVHRSHIHDIIHGRVWKHI